MLVAEQEHRASDALACCGTEPAHRLGTILRYPLARIETHTDAIHGRGAATFGSSPPEAQRLGAIFTHTTAKKVATRKQFARTIMAMLDGKA